MQKKDLKKLVRKALDEDIGRGDLTTSLTVPSDARCRAVLVAKQDGVLSGIEPFRAAFNILRAGDRDWEALSDATSFKNGDTIATFTGATPAVLTGERTAMNFVQHLSGIATSTAAYVKAVQGLGARICDTRKTTPLLRDLEKEAVLHGGGSNHRHGLHDGILIKENHIAAGGGITEAVGKAASGLHHLMKIEIEVTNLAECEEAVQAGAHVVLLDNMAPADMAKAVEAVRGTGVLLEASGNVSLDTVRAIAETGVDLISVGALTHSAPAVDLSLLISEA